MAVENGVTAGDAADRAEEAMARLLVQKAATGRELQQRLEAAIRSGDLPVGCRMFTERRIAEEVGLSRATVRSALDNLERAGLVSRQVGRGTFVARAVREGNLFGGLPVRPSPSQLMEFRSLVEPQLADVLVLSASDEALDSIARLVLNSRGAKDWRETEAVDTAFHGALCRATGNPLFTALADLMTIARQQPGWIHLKESRFDWDRWHRYQSEHEAIIAALQARDADLARRLLREHLSLISLRFAL
ncbi:FadR/GntR family transcriptional regulator [Aquabacter cavernae]|uniref:FadR/GntR family transcriptional regulator n=1 Tax=Aquabacter cavernae TaxID=2496029 RepID=UPI000F8DC5B0|nr:FCD domain-containing protein [Aquabacter cavernae]